MLLGRGIFLFSFFSVNSLSMFDRTFIVCRHISSEGHCHSYFEMSSEIKRLTIAEQIMLHISFFFDGLYYSFQTHLHLNKLCLFLFRS